MKFVPASYTLLTNQSDNVWQIKSNIIYYFEDKHDIVCVLFVETSNGTIPIEAVEQRLEPPVDVIDVDDDTDASLPYGPALPPPSQG